MSKLYRSLLWSGLVVAGVAACGDNVTPPPPPPTPTVHSVSVAPNPGTIAPGGTLQMVVSVNADATVPTTVTWSSNNAAVSVSTTGLATAIAAAVQGTSIAITACSTVATGVCGSASVTVSSTSPTVSAVAVTPPSGNVVKPAGAATGTLQLSAAVTGSNNPSQLVTWSLVSSPVGATISASGLLTITSAITAGVVNVSACSTVAGFTGVCGFSAVTINTPTPASVSLSSVTWIAPTGPTVCTPGPGPAVAVPLGNVRCQIEVVSNVNAGDQILGRLDVLIGGRVVASQTFPGTSAPFDGPQAVSAPVDISLSVNTQQLSRPGAAGTPFIPVIFNGNQAISLNLYTAGGSLAASSQATPVVMNNTDAILAPNSLAATTATPSFNDGVTTWFKGSLTYGGAQYISFSTKVPTSVQFTASVCGTSATAGSVTGTASTGIPITSTFSCAGFEGLASITAPFPTIVQATLVGPDGTAVTIPTVYSNVGSAFLLPANNASGNPAEQRWNLITPASPAPTLPGPVAIDNKGPVTTIGVIAYNAAYDQNWVNGSYDLSAQVIGTDGGSGALGGVTTSTRFWNPLPVLSPSCSGALLTTATASSLAETLTSAGFDAYQICGVSTDPLGNIGTSVASNKFGVDKTAPVGRLAGSTLAAPSIGPNNPSTVSTTANTTIYATPAQINNQVWGLEGSDTRSGFNQFVVAGDDAAHQALTQTLASGVTTCPLTNDQLTVVLSDSWVRSPVLTFIDCGSGTGYYDYTGYVIDRAGNTSTPIVRNFAEDLAAPATSFITPAQVSYLGGSAAAFNIFANDDLEVLKAYLAFSFPTLGPPATGILYPYGSFAGLIVGQPWPSNPPISALVPSLGVSGTISIPYLLARIDESCTGAAIPYPSCGAVLGSKPTTGADYNRDLNLNAPTLSNAAQAPTGVQTNVSDIALRDGVTGSAFAFNPAVKVTPVGEQWSGVVDVATWIGKNSSGDCPPSTICADQTTSTSNGLRFFSGAGDTVSLWRLNATNQWVYCTDLVSGGSLPFIDNGVFRVWRWTSSIPSAPNACAAFAGFFRVMGSKGGAGLFSPSF